LEGVCASVCCCAALQKLCSAIGGTIVCPPESCRAAGLARGRVSSARSAVRLCACRSLSTTTRSACCF